MDDELIVGDLEQEGDEETSSAAPAERCRPLVRPSVRLSVCQPAYLSA